MKQAIYLIIMLAVSVSTGCTSGGSKKNVVSCLLADTIHTQQVAMSIYDYQPVQALQIIDSAVIVGNMGEVQAEQCKARIYSFTLMHDQIDSMLDGTKDVRLDSAQAIGERLLNNDSIKADLKRLRDVMEILAYTERMQNDTLGMDRTVAPACQSMP